MLFNNKKKLLYRDWIIEWLSEQKNYIKESTYANYSTMIFNHLIPVLGNYYIGNIDNKILQKLINDKYRNGRLDKNGGLSNKTIKDLAAIIKLSFKRAIKNELIFNINLDFSYPKSEKVDKPHILNKIEQKKLVNYIIENKSAKNIGVLLTLYSGIRIGELCALKWNDIDFKKNILHINKTVQRVYIKTEKGSSSKIIITTPKTKNANRDIPLNNGFAMLFREFQTNDNDYILSGTEKWVEPRTYRKYFCKLLKTVGINYINFHSLRHTFATNCIRLGTDYKTVSELLGHSTVNITLNLYVHPQMSQKKKCINLICKEFQKY